MKPFFPILQVVLIYFHCISHPWNSCEASVWTSMEQNWRCLCDDVWNLRRAMSCNGMRCVRYKSCTSFDGKMDMPRPNESRWSMLFKVDETFFGQRRKRTFVIFWNETAMQWQRKTFLNVLEKYVVLVFLFCRSSCLCSSTTWNGRRCSFHVWNFSPKLWWLWWGCFGSERVWNSLCNASG